MSETAIAESDLEADAAKRDFIRASVVNVLGNAVKIIVEALAGLAFGSVALLADAAHSVADLVASIV
ncbi:MAG: cation transporter, partial [Natronomonas sp.]